MGEPITTRQAISVCGHKTEVPTGRDDVRFRAKIGSSRRTVKTTRLTPFGHRTRRLAPIHDLLKRLDPMAVAILLLVAGFRMGARVLINEMWY